MGVTSDSLANRYFSSSSELNSILNSNDWWIHSGANVHACTDKTLFSSYQVSGTRTVSIGNGSVARVLGEGQVKLKLSFGKFLELDDVYHVPNISKHLISMCSLD